MNLVEFLKVRLDEDEEAARAIERRHWDTHDTHVSAGGHCAAVLSRNPDDEWDVQPVAWLPTFQMVGWDVPGPWANAAHIARHDPVRVLAEVDAKRRILDEHPEVTTYSTDFAGTERIEVPEWACGRCADPTDGRSGIDIGNGRWHEEFPCRTLRLLALAYADHPDYQQEWRPA